MHKMTNKRKAVFLALTFIVIVGTYVYKNYVNKPIETPTTFINKVEEQPVTTETTTGISAEKEDVSRQFISSFFSFNKDSLESVTDLTNENLRSKLEKDSQNQPVEVRAIELIDSSMYENEQQFVYTYIATDKQTKKEKKGKVLLILETKEKQQQIKDYEWSYEKED